MAQVRTAKTKSTRARGSGTAQRGKRQDGPRTTLRLPKTLVEVAERFGQREGITRNDAVVRLAEVGALQQERLDQVAARSGKRLSAWRRREATGRFPTADELATAVSLARSESSEDER